MKKKLIFILVFTVAFSVLSMLMESVLAGLTPKPLWINALIGLLTALSVLAVQSMSGTLREKGRAR
jgi:hypothetical protein